jgi:predicted nucleotidyltransferase
LNKILDIAAKKGTIITTINLRDFELDFKHVIEKLLTAFKDEDIRYALIGGFALGALGIARATVDIDFLVHRDDLEKVHAIMTGLGYQRPFHTENVSQYVSADTVFGEVDFLHAFREISIGMLQRAENKKIFNETLSIRVLRIEDLIGLKVQAMANDDARKDIDLSDIRALIDLYKSAVDWPLLEKYFSMFGFQELFKNLRKAGE